jgi:hypothetical protein
MGGRTPPGERIERLSIPVTESGCWLWIGYLNHYGYGRFCLNGKAIGAHRASWIAFNGPIPIGMHVLHRCDVRSCVNPDHLFLGTQSDNVRDMHAKGRHPGGGAKGEASHTAKLTEADVRYIRNTEKYTKGLSKRFGVSNSRISAIRKRVNWRHI